MTPSSSTRSEVGRNKEEKAVENTFPPLWEGLQSPVDLFFYDTCPKCWLGSCTSMNWSLRPIELLLNRRCPSQKVGTKEQLQQLILLNKFQNCVPETVATNLREQRVSLLRWKLVAITLVLQFPLSKSSRRTLRETRSPHSWVFLVPWASLCYGLGWLLQRVLSLSSPEPH